MKKFRTAVSSEVAHFVIYSSELGVDFQCDIGQVLILPFVLEGFRKLHVQGVDPQGNVANALKTDG